MIRQDYKPTHLLVFKGRPEYLVVAENEIVVAFSSNVPGDMPYWISTPPKPESSTLGSLERNSGYVIYELTGLLALAYD